MKEIQWRCAYGAHPFSSRTRWLRRKRPMVLYWRRYGRVGGCWIINKISKISKISWGLSSVGRAPALQAGGREFESLSLHCSERAASLHLENRILKRYLFKEKSLREASVRGRMQRLGLPKDRDIRDCVHKHTANQVKTRTKRPEAERYPPTQ